jgi:hypothetical protein
VGVRCTGLSRPGAIHLPFILTLFLKTGEFAEAGKQLERLREALRRLDDGNALPAN